MDIEKEKMAIERLKAFQPDDGYYLCYSGGKDSDTIRIIADIGDIKYECHNNHTTVDAPETVYYIRQVMGKYGERVREVGEDGAITYRYGTQGFVHIPKKSMWDLIAERNMPPTRLVRYCCSELKEKGGKGRLKVTGVRWAESLKRKNNRSLVDIEKKKRTLKAAEELGAEYEEKKYAVSLNLDNAENRRLVEHCYRTDNTFVNPIIDWTDEDVWSFLHHYGCESNPLYKCGDKRVGCIGCPLQGSNGMKADFAKYPKYKDAYLRAFAKMVENNKRKCIEHSYFTNAESVMRWWLGENPDQITIDDYLSGYAKDLGGQNDV